MPKCGDLDYWVEVDGMKLEEIIWNGESYVGMPIHTAKSSYKVPFIEELPDKEINEQMWPVCPYKVVVRNRGQCPLAATLYVDGSEIKQQVVKPGECKTYDGVSDGQSIRELLFSLPRYATLQEKKRNHGRAIDDHRASELGSMKVVFRECRYSHQFTGVLAEDVKDRGFVQANKFDTTARAVELFNNGVKTRIHETAATTRTGRAVRVVNNGQQNIAQYTYDGCDETKHTATLKYRMPHWLQEVGAIPDPERDARFAANAAKRRRRNENAGPVDVAEPVAAAAQQPREREAGASTPTKAMERADAGEEELDLTAGA